MLRVLVLSVFVHSSFTDPTCPEHELTQPHIDATTTTTGRCNTRRLENKNGRENARRASGRMQCRLGLRRLFSTRRHTRPTLREGAHCRRKPHASHIRTKSQRSFSEITLGSKPPSATHGHGTHECSRKSHSQGSSCCQTRQLMDEGHERTLTRVTTHHRRIQNARGHHVLQIMLTVLKTSFARATLGAATRQSTRNHLALGHNTLLIIAMELTGDFTHQPEHHRSHPIQKKQPNAHPGTIVANWQLAQYL